MNAANMIDVDLSNSPVLFVQLCAMKGAVRMETLGLKKRGRSAYAIAKERYGLKGSKEKVLHALNLMVANALDARERNVSYVIKIAPQN